MLTCSKLTGPIPNSTNLKAKMTNGADYFFLCVGGGGGGVYELRHCEGVMAVAARALQKSTQFGAKVLLRGIRSHHKRHSGRLLQ